MKAIMMSMYAVRWHLVIATMSIVIGMSVDAKRCPSSMTGRARRTTMTGRMSPLLTACSGTIASGTVAPMSNFAS